MLSSNIYFYDKSLILKGGLFITWSNIIVEAEHSLISSIAGNFKIFEFLKVIRGHLITQFCVFLVLVSTN